MLQPGPLKAEAQRVAIMAQDGFAGAIRPVHTPFDGDTVFVLATGRWPLPEPRAMALLRVGAAAPAQHLAARFRGERIGRRHHVVSCDDGLPVGDAACARGALLSRGQTGRDQA